jgi:hypothetical protein
VYSWNWELPLRREQVLVCPKTPPPELTKQQQAVAAAAAAAAAAKAVAAGAAPDSIHALPAVQGLTSVLGKRQHAQQAALSVVPPSGPLVMGQMTSPVAGMPCAAASGGGSIDERVRLSWQDRCVACTHGCSVFAGLLQDFAGCH